MTSNFVPFPPGVYNLIANPDAPAADDLSWSNGDSATFDDQLFPNGLPEVNSNGLLFISTDGTSVVNIFNLSSSATTYDFAEFLLIGPNITFDSGGYGSFALASPEPASLPILGIAAIGLVARRRKTGRDRK